MKIAPDFSLPDQSGKIVNLKKILATKQIVLFFYPKDETPGCIAEVCGFRDKYEQFIDAGAEIIGISSDSVDSHKSFHTKYKLPFKLLSDINGKIRKEYKVPSTLGLIPGRVTYIISQNGMIIYSFNSQFNIDKHINEALRILKEKK